MSDRKARIAVVICSVGRPECLRGLMPALARQTLAPRRVVIVVACEEDVDVDPQSFFSDSTRAEVVIAPKGACPQRNRGLDAVQGDCELVVFFDDDYVPSRFALAGIQAAFDAFPTVNGMTGFLIADGINSAGFSQAEADQMVESWDQQNGSIQAVDERFVTNWQPRGLYGCNMAFRLSAVGETRFDERLPLYAWQEDIDFGARVPGIKVVTTAFAGVHRGTKRGREAAGTRLGYSQIANPYYLWRKGTMTTAFAGKIVFRNLVANHLKTSRPEPWIDRKGRAAGNRQALLDILLGRSDPRRILDF